MTGGMSVVDAFGLLGLDVAADRRTVAQARRQRLRRHHPDASGSVAVSAAVNAAARVAATVAAAATDRRSAEAAAAWMLYAACMRMGAMAGTTLRAGLSADPAVRLFVVAAGTARRHARAGAAPAAAAAAAADAVADDPTSAADLRGLADGVRRLLL